MLTFVTYVLLASALGLLSHFSSSAAMAVRIVHPFEGRFEGEVPGQGSSAACNDAAIAQGIRSNALGEDELATCLKQAVSAELPNKAVELAGSLLRVSPRSEFARRVLLASSFQSDDKETALNLISELHRLDHRNWKQYQNQKHR